MDVDWSAYNISYFLDAAYEALSKRKTFLNLDLAEFFYLYYIILLFKSCVAGYGMVHVIPQPLTYVFLFIQVSVHFLLRETWFFHLGEILHAVTHLGILSWIHEVDEYASSCPNFVTWYYYSSFAPAEFFLDCYVALTFVYYIGKYFSINPHKLSTMMCVLFTLNWLTDQIVGEETTTTLVNIIYFYIPILFLFSFRTREGVNVLPETWGSIWMVLKMSDIEFNKTPAGRFTDSLIDSYEKRGFEDYLEEFANRKSFLNVDKNEHYVIFYILLLLKSYIASYAVRNVVGLPLTLKMMVINFNFAVCDVCILQSVYAIFSSLIRTLFIVGYQYALHVREFPLGMAISSGTWYFVCCDDSFHFFLDVYLIVSVLLYILEAYRGESDKLSSLIWILYLIDWFGDKFVGKPLSGIATIATLYLPVVLISCCTAINSRNRIFSMLVFITLWFLFKNERSYFEYSVNKYIFNFYETARTIVVNQRDMFLE